MARPTKETVRIQFSEALERKLAAWSKKNPPPIPPTDREIVEDFKTGRIVASAKCSCKVKEFSYRYSAPAAEDFHTDHLVQSRSVLAFAKKAQGYQKKKDLFVAGLKKRRDDYANPVLYSKGDFVVNLRNFERSVDK